MKKRDFTLDTYLALLDALQKAGYAFQTYVDFIKNPAPRAVVLRHDVDRRKQNSLTFAQIQHAQNIAGSYYFRIVPQSWDDDIIREMHRLGHEIGLHYEDIAIVRKHGNSSREVLIDNGYKHFCKNLERLRALVPVETICNHGSPLSPYDNKMIWEKYDYKTLGIIAEPYLDTDFSITGYLTDTGRRWNGHAVTVRDRIGEGGLTFPDIRTTHQLIRAIEERRLPNRLMLTFHPQRWSHSIGGWLSEFILQNLKNGIKRGLVMIRP